MPAFLCWRTEMIRAASFYLAASLATAILPCPLRAQSAADVQNYFQGKQVQLKIDMPGTQQGVDLRFDRGTPMDWKQYSSRLKKFGVAIPKDGRSTITTISVKKDMIEFQLDGGGFGTFGDDTNTTVAAKPVEKSNYEKQLEQDIANTDDPDKKRDLQHSLDREVQRRQRQDAANQRAAQVASQIKAQQVADNRMRGGSRFNLRWSKSIPEKELSPEAIMKLLADYVDFSGLQAGRAELAPGAAPASQPVPNQPPSVSPTAQLQRGMSLNDVTNLLGQGKLLSESVGDNGLKTQVYEYISGDRRAEVTLVEGTVVKFTITSR